MSTLEEHASVKHVPQVQVKIASSQQQQQQFTISNTVVQLQTCAKCSHQMSFGCFISANPSTMNMFTSVLTSMTFGRSTLHTRQDGV